MRLSAFFASAVVAFLIGGCEEAPVAPQEVLEEPWFELHGEWLGVSGGVAEEKDGVLRMSWGEALTAVRWQGEVPSVPFELEAEARRIDGTDFFFSVTFPGRTEEEAASLIVGGWGGGVVGISSIDGLDASENETTLVRPFEVNRWYEIRMEVTPEHLRVWIDGEGVIDVPIEGKTLSLRSGPIEQCLPFGVATWQTTGEARGMRWRPLSEGLQP
ncbi:conserved hypothetical protein [Haloferula helveola]|uniref:3-keto-disaccharide hydrolase domain-containing protein n=1 Tax=Haloferula helveola TaxID=490095 RepID=A0ABM7RGN1_9BACT|nr:conserved hypothetical protein [Haloferula helveola]